MLLVDPVVSSVFRRQYAKGVSHQGARRLAEEISVMWGR